LSLPDYLKVYFWDIEIDELDLRQHSHFIISRILNEGNDQALKLLVDQMPLPGSYLAGGTALALILGHRQSVDLDWFYPHDFDPEQLARQLSNLEAFETSDAARGTLQMPISIKPAYRMRRRKR